MKRLQLGKILLLLMLPLLAWGGVSATVDKNALYRGDNVTLTIAATGDDIEFPEINEIGGNPIISQSRSQNLSMINGSFTKTISKSFTFSPQKSLRIPSYSVTIDGAVEKTAEIEVKIVVPSQDKSAPVVLDVNLSKTEVHVGEPVMFSVTFKKKPNIPIYKLDIEEPKFEGFWVKKIEGMEKGTDGEYSTQTTRYLLFAQKSGTIEIPPLTAKIGQLTRNSRRGMDPFFSSAFGQQIQYTKIFSNGVSLHAKPLPSGLELYGQFKIRAEVDRTTVLANKPVNVTLTVEGVGNIDDVQKFNLDIAGAVVYANEPTVESYTENGAYGGVFKQKIVVIADQNYTIPPLTLRYFDAKTASEQQVETAPIKVEVTGGVATKSTLSTPQQNSGLEVPKESAKSEVAVVPSTSYSEMALSALVGFLMGALLVWLMMRDRVQKKRVVKVDTIEKQIKSAKDDKALFELLLPYKNQDKGVDEVLEALAENLYHSANHKIDKKVLLDFFNEEEKVVELL